MNLLSALLHIKPLNLKTNRLNDDGNSALYYYWLGNRIFDSLSGHEIGIKLSSSEGTATEN
jgi:hypothetical protein